MAVCRLGATAWAGSAGATAGSGVTQHFAQACIVKQKPAILINHEERRRAELQQLAKLTFLLGSLGIECGTAIGPCRLRDVIRHGFLAG